MEGRKRYLSLFAVFVAALLSGYLGEMGVLQTSAEATLEELTREMARVIKILEPVMQPEAFDRNRVQVKGVPAAFYPVISRQLIKSLPDGKWQFDKAITRGEGLFYFANLLDSLSREMVLFPIIIGIEPTYVDIGPDHWLRKPLIRLAGVGALSGVSGNRLNPDSAMTHKELRNIGSAMIDYFGSNHILIVFDGKVGKMRTKGALHQIDLQGWYYSFNRQDWYAVDEKGLVIPDFSKAKRQAAWFMNDSYMMAGPFELVDGVSSAGMIKIRRKYSESMSHGADNKVAKATGINENDDERAQLKKRLIQIQQTFQKRRNSRQEASPVTSGLPVARKSVTVKEMAMPVTEEVPIPDTDQDVPANEIAEMPEKSSDEPTNESPTEAPTEAQEEVMVETSRFSQKLKADSSDRGEVKYDGAVLDAVTGKPVKGAVVVIAAHQYNADDSGKFIFSASPNSVLDLTAYSEGYEALSLRHKAGYRSGPLTLSLKPVLASLSGRIIHSESGAPVPRVVVKVGTKATRSDSEGNFSFKGLKPGYQQLSCFARSFMEAHEIIYVGSEPAEVVEVKLRPIFEEYAGSR